MSEVWLKKTLKFSCNDPDSELQGLEPFTYLIMLIHEGISFVEQSSVVPFRFLVIWVCIGLYMSGVLRGSVELMCEILGQWPHDMVVSIVQNHINTGDLLYLVFICGRGHRSLLR